MMIFLIWLVVVVVWLTTYFRKVYSKFERCGVKCLKPIPFLGNVASLAMKQTHIVEDNQKLYSAFPNERFVGQFMLMRPVVMIRDLELVKQVTVKDFEHFLDHCDMVDKNVDPIFGRSMFSMKGQEWKDMRSTLSPAFTGAKMRCLVPFMVEGSKQMINALNRKIKQSDTGYIDVDVKDLMTRSSNDVIASCGFGFKVDSHSDMNNKFYEHAKTTAHFSFRRVLVYFGSLCFPNFMKILNLKLLSEESNQYFERLFVKTILDREEKNIFRPDMIHLLLNAKKGNLKYDKNVESKNAGFATVEESDVGRRTVNRSWSDSELAAQALFFLLASFETLSTAMCFLLHELAVNPDVQERLAREFKENDEKNGGIDYSSIQHLKYLDMVVSEVLRLWPLGVGIDRLCTKDYNLGQPNDTATSDYIIRKGELLLVSVWSIHRDPNYFPDPEKFDPERFSEENKSNIKPYTYMPFGSGPRNCIGSRFALCFLKVTIYHILMHFHVSPTEKTRIPVKLVPGSVLLTVQGGNWLRFRRRE